MSGPPPQPSNVVALKGNPGKRPRNEDEPQPDEGMPKCPVWLDGKAKAAWSELQPLLEKIKVVTEADRKSLELLCDAYSEYREARAAVKKLGATYETVNKAGSVMYRTRPEVAIAQDAWKRVRAMLCEFGLTPSARSKVKVLKGEPDDPYERYRRKRKS
jgi:P27 family predicted phage terminase small subunit